MSKKEAYNFIIQSKFAALELQFLDHISTEQAKGAFHRNKCTHVACERGMKLHDCPDEWRRLLKSTMFAAAYGGTKTSRSDGSSVG